MTDAFEPKIVGFLCNWCSYAGADAAGAQHRDVPANLKVVRVMCSGRVDPQFILKAFKEGADGVMVLGCHPGDCHYKEGNYKTLRRMKLMERLLLQFGIEKERFVLDWISAGEGEKFSRITGDMARNVQKLGPLLLDGRELPPEPEAKAEAAPEAKAGEEPSTNFDDLLKQLDT